MPKIDHQMKIRNQLFNKTIIQSPRTVSLLYYYPKDTRAVYLPFPLISNQRWRNIILTY